MSGDTVSEDAELFISKFLERNSQQYADFVEAWNEMKFARFYWYLYTAMTDTIF